MEVRAKERKSDFTGVEVLSTGNGVGKSINKGIRDAGSTADFRML